MTRKSDFLIKCYYCSVKWSRPVIGCYFCAVSRARENENKRGATRAAEKEIGNQWHARYLRNAPVVAQRDTDACHSPLERENCVELVFFLSSPAGKNPRNLSRPVPRVAIIAARVSTPERHHTGGVVIILHFSISFSRMNFYITRVSMHFPRIAESQSREQTAIAVASPRRVAPKADDFHLSGFGLD